MRVDTTFEMHYSIGDVAKQWRLGRETVRLLVKDEPGVLKIRQRAMTRYSVPESVARRVHTKLFNSACQWAASRWTDIYEKERRGEKVIQAASGACDR